MTAQHQPAEFFSLGQDQLAHVLLGQGKQTRQFGIVQIGHPLVVLEFDVCFSLRPQRFKLRCDPHHNIVSDGLLGTGTALTCCCNHGGCAPPAARNP